MDQLDHDSRLRLSDSQTYSTASLLLKLAIDGEEAMFESTAREKPIGLLWYDKTGRTLLHVAAAENRTRVIKYLASISFDLNAKDELGQTALHEAVQVGNVEAIHVLIVAGAETSLVNNNGMSPVLLAVELNQVGSLEALLSHRDRVDPNIADAQGYTGIHYAASKNHPDCIEILFKYGASPRKKSKAGLSALSLAAYSGSAAIIKAFWRYAIDNEVNLEYFMNTSDAEGNLILHAAVDSGSLECVQVCLECCSFIDAQQDDKSTPVHFAALRGELKMLQAMSSAQPDRMPNALRLCDKNGMTPLHKAVLFDKAETVEFLLDQGAIDSMNAVDCNCQTPLLLAAAKGSMNCVKLLLQRGADATQLDKDGRNFLHLAIINGAQVDDLLRNDQMKNCFRAIMIGKDHFGCTPLHYASIEGRMVVGYLLAEDSSLHIRTNNGITPLHLAAKYGRYHTCKRLLETADGLKSINWTDKRGMTALHFAAKNGNTKVVQLLLKRGAIFHKCHAGKSAFLLAAEEGHLKTMKLMLLVSPHLLNLPCNVGGTPLHVAAVNGRVSEVQFLLSEGATIAHNSDGCTFFDLAIKKRQKEVCCAAVHHDRWREILTTVSTTYPTPIFGLIEELPDICYAVLERCISKSSDHPKSSAFSIVYDFSLLELTELSCNKPKAETKSTIDDDGDFVSFGARSRADPATRSVQLENRNIHESVYATALPVVSHMIKFRRVDLLASPLCTAYLNTKWYNYGRLHAYKNALQHFFAVVVLLVYVSSSQNAVRCHLRIHWNCEDSTNQTCADTYLQRHDCTVTLVAKVCQLLLLSFAVILTPQNLLQLYLLRFKYLLDMKNILTTIVVTYIYLFVIPTLSHPEMRVIHDYQWASLAVAVTLESFVLILEFRLHGVLGLYVVMFEEILKTFGKFSITFSSLLLGFALSFTILFQVPIENSEEFDMYTPALAYKNPVYSMIRVLVMETGELDFSETVLDGLTDPNLRKGVPFPVTTLVLFTSFVIFVTIALFNMIVGLAIGDIKVIRSNATLKRINIQCQFYSMLERGFLLYPNTTVCRQETRPKSVTVFPNVKCSNIIDRSQRLDESAEGPNKSMTQAMQLESRIAFQMKVEKNFDKFKERFKKIRAVQDRQLEQIHRLLSKIDRDFDSSYLAELDKTDKSGDKSASENLKSARSKAVVDWGKIFQAVVDKGKSNEFATANSDNRSSSKSDIVLVNYSSLKR